MTAKDSIGRRTTLLKIAAPTSRYSGLLPGARGRRVDAGDPDAAVLVVLEGKTNAVHVRDTARFTKPSVTRRMSGSQRENVASLMRTNWGNDAGPIDPTAFASLRSYEQRETSQ